MVTTKTVLPPVVLLATVFGALPASFAQGPAACNLVQNGNFSNVISVGPGGDIAHSTVPNWGAAFLSPQIHTTPGCEDDPGFVSMWGNMAVGEGIRQTLATPIKKGGVYRLRACVRWVNSTNAKEPYVRFNVRASQGGITSYAPSVPLSPAAQIGIIGVSTNTPSIAAPGITSTNWTYVTVQDWVAPDNYDTIVINPENNSIANNREDMVSWGQIDRICLQDIKNPCPGPDPDFTLTATAPSGTTNYYSLNATAAPVPAGASYYWRVEEIDQGGQVINTLENPSAWWANPLATDFSGYCCTNAATPPGKFELGHRYRIVRGVWGTCHGWTEVAKTVFMCKNCRARTLQIHTTRAGEPGANARNKAVPVGSPVLPAQVLNAEATSGAATK